MTIYDPKDDDLQEGKPSLEIHKMLVLSTMHVSQSTAELLDIGCPSIHNGHCADGIGYPKGDYGWFVYVPEEPEQDSDIPADLLAVVVAFARAQACNWVMFDRDADKIDDLPVFDWGNGEADKFAPDMVEEKPCSGPNGHEWVYTGTQYGGDDTSYGGEGRVYCAHCGADGDA